MSTKLALKLYLNFETLQTSSFIQSDTIKHTNQFLYTVEYNKNKQTSSFIQSDTIKHRNQFLNAVEYNKNTQTSSSIQ